MTLFDGIEMFQCFNWYRSPDAKNPEKVLRTFGDKRHCEKYREKWRDEVTLDIEPYNGDEWASPKKYGCFVQPCETWEKK